MTDVEYILKADAREKKANGRGDRNKKRCGGRNVCFQNDHMTRKEWSKMNGEVKSYDMGKTMTWEEFKALPDDIAKEYIKRILNCFESIPQQEIAKALGVSVNTFHKQMKERSFGTLFKRGGDRRSEHSFYKSKTWIKFEDWRQGKISLKDIDSESDDAQVKDVEPEVVIEPEAVAEPEAVVADASEEPQVLVEPVVPDTAEVVRGELENMTLANIVAMLRGLGVSAEISINIKV